MDLGGTAVENGAVTRRPSSDVGTVRESAPGAPATMIYFPSRRGRPSRTAFRSFVLFVLVPVLMATYYYVFVAKDLYLSEFRFSVTEQMPALPSSQAPSPSTAGTSGVASNMAAVTTALLGGSSAGSGSVQNFIVADYVQSPAALAAVQKKIDVRSLLSKGSGDWLFEVPANAADEDVFRAWQRLVVAYYDPVSNLASVKVSAYTPSDALLLAQTLLQVSEQLVNDLANQGNDASVTFATAEVVRARGALGTALKAIEKYRRDNQVINPSLSIAQANIDLIGSLRLTIMQLETEAKALSSQSLSVKSPVAVELKARIASSRQQLEGLQRGVKTSATAQKAISEVVGRYEVLDLERQYALAAYTNAVLAADQAQANAVAQHIYLTPYSNPVRPESRNSPDRLLAIFAVFLLCTFFWFFSYIMIRAIRDHNSKWMA